MSSLSVALTTFNGASYLEEQLSSLAAQEHLPAELVAVDDGSTDGTVDILRAFAQRAPFRVDVHCNSNRLGWRANFIRAATLCRSQLIAFCDQDDVWYPNKIVKVEHLFSDPSTLLVHHNADLMDHEGAPLGRLDQSKSFPVIQDRLERPTTWANPLGLTMTFRRSLLQFAPFWPLSRDPTALNTAAAHDQFFYRLAINLGRVRYIAEPLLAYRQHGGNAVGFTHKDPRSLRNKLFLPRSMEPELRTLDSFCCVLSAAQSSNSTSFGSELAEAQIKNAAYRDRLSLASLAHKDVLPFKRAQHLLNLLRSSVIAGDTTWGLGYRVFLTAFILGVPFGR